MKPILLSSDNDLLPIFIGLLIIIVLSVLLLRWIFEVSVFSKNSKVQTELLLLLARQRGIFKTDSQVENFIGRHEIQKQFMHMIPDKEEKLFPVEEEDLSDGDDMSRYFEQK